MVTDQPANCGNTETSGGMGGNVQFHLDSGKWAVVTGFEVQTNSHGDRICKPVVQQNLDSASCN
jgi:hypothetical protein